MDDRRFDALARSLAAGASRRLVLKGLFGGIIGGAALGGAGKTFAQDEEPPVEETDPTTNFGTWTALAADASPAKESYLRFEVSGVGGVVTNATLRHDKNRSRSAIRCAAVRKFGSFPRPEESLTAAWGQI